MNRNILMAVISLLVITAGLFWLVSTNRSDSTAYPSEPVSSGEDTAIRAFVTDFGTKLKMVSLLAPDAAAQIGTQYAPYLSAELLAAWKQNPQEALGKQTSSPWPDSIEVASVTSIGGEIYTVEANIVEVASGTGDVTPVEPVAVQPVTFTVAKEGTGYQITAVAKGTYGELPQRQTVTGTWECLPHKDTSGPQTLECAFGIALDQSDGHLAVDTSLMSTYPVDYPTGTHVRISGIVTPVQMLSSVQKYDIDGIIRATAIEKL